MTYLERWSAFCTHWHAEIHWLHKNNCL